jgi:hypothetical protein
MVSVGIISAFILLLVFRPYERMLNRLVSRIGRDRTSLLTYILLTLGIPIALLLIG